MEAVSSRPIRSVSAIISRLEACDQEAVATHQGMPVADIDELAFDIELDRINRAAEEKRGTYFFPALYTRGTNPAADEALCHLRTTSKAFELNLRFREIEKLDNTHAKLWEVLSANGRIRVTLAEFKEVVKEVDAWRRAQDGDAPEGSKPKEERDMDDPSPASEPRGKSPAVRQPSSIVSSASRRRTGSQSLSCVSRLEASISLVENRRRPVGQVLYANTVPLPRVTLQLFLTCPRSPIFPEYVDTTSIYQSFAKKVSLVKCEAELIMCDVNNDGRLAEDEMEQYVSDLVPRIVALRDVAETVLPFYCCTATRRIFWDLDPYSRGVIRIDALLQSTVMDEWVRLQLMTEDSPQNWFGGFVTQQLYDKFLMLDSRNEGTLNADNLKRYKKGLPTVSDDGLPIDVSPLSTLFIDRFFETNVMMPNSEMDYRKFVDFVIAVEMLPQCSRPHFFWNILDMEGVGYLTPMVVNCFYRETYAKLISAGLDVPTRETVVQEVFDLIPTAEPLLITREEFLNCPQAGLFSALIIDCLSFWTYENREAR